MNFFLVRGKQHLDLSGNIILSKNRNFVEAPVKSSAPRIHRAKYFMLQSLTTRQKIVATFRVIGFIWGRNL